MRIEEKIGLLEAEIHALRKQMQAAQDRHEIENLMGEYHVNHNQKNMAKSLQFYALKQPDVFIEIGDIGKFVGEKNLRKLFEENYQIKDNRGNMLLHWLCSPMIEVAADGQTAKGLWASPGAESIVMADGTHQALWNFIQYAVDFIKEDDAWKIWHMYVFVTVKCDYEKGWCRDYEKWLYKGKYPGSNDDPVTWNNVYSPSFIQEAVPAGPKPYETFTDDSWIFDNEPELAPEGMRRT